MRVYFQKWKDGFEYVAYIRVCPCLGCKGNKGNVHSKGFNEVEETLLGKQQQ